MPRRRCARPSPPPLPERPAAVHALRASAEARIAAISEAMLDPATTDEARAHLAAVREEWRVALAGRWS